MSQLQTLKSANSINDVAALLTFKPSAVAFILYKKPPETKYRTFEIAKRQGGTRVIKAPSDDLKLLQKRLSDLLQNCIEEINAAKTLKDDLAHGFKRHRSIITNATKHAGAKHIKVTMDFGEDQLGLTILDDGCGFDPGRPRTGKGGFGLVGMRERATGLKAELNVRTAPGQGTEIRLQVPLSGD